MALRKQTVVLGLAPSQISIFLSSLWTHASLCLKRRDCSRRFLRLAKRKVPHTLSWELTVNDLDNQQYGWRDEWCRVLALALPVLSSSSLSVRTVDSSGTDGPQASGLQPQQSGHRHFGYHGPSGQGWANGNVLCCLFFHFTEGAVAGSQASHSAVSAVAVTLATVTFGGYWIRVEGVWVTGTARQPYGLVHQFLEGTYFLSVGSSWVLIHQILRSSAKGEQG